MIKILFAAIVAIESGGNENAVGDCGKSFGPAQIGQQVVADCNRIAAASYTMHDCFSAEKSFEMFLIYTEHYGKAYGLPVSPETRARIWNGGPNGPRKKATLTYWIKIKGKI